MLGFARANVYILTEGDALQGVQARPNLQRSGTTSFTGLATLYLAFSRVRTWKHPQLLFFDLGAGAENGLFLAIPINRLDCCHRECPVDAHGPRIPTKDSNPSGLSPKGTAFDRRVPKGHQLCPFVLLKLSFT